MYLTNSGVRVISPGGMIAIPVPAVQSFSAAATPESVAATYKKRFGAKAIAKLRANALSYERKRQRTKAQLLYAALAILEGQSASVAATSSAVVSPTNTGVVPPGYEQTAYTVPSSSTSSSLAGVDGSYVPFPIFSRDLTTGGIPSGLTDTPGGQPIPSVVPAPATSKLVPILGVAGVGLLIWYMMRRKGRK